MADICQGIAVVTLTLLAFIGLVWLREQILHGGGPEWLDHEIQPVDRDHNHHQQHHQHPAAGQEEQEAADQAGNNAQGEGQDAAENDAAAREEGPVFGPAWVDMDDEVCTKPIRVFFFSNIFSAGVLFLGQ